MVRAGVSSMNSGSVCRSCDARLNDWKSSRLILPMRNASPEIPDCSARMRVASWSADISRLKKATLAPIFLSRSIPSSSSRRKRWAALNAMLVASAVLPMPGRPARISRSESCRPPIFWLMLASPVVMPERCPPELSARSAILTASVVACAKLLTAPSSISPPETR